MIVYYTIYEINVFLTQIITNMSKFGELVDSNSEDIQDAVSSAKDAFASWSGLSFTERADYIMAIADEIDAQSDTFSELESRDTGKPLSLARSLLSLIHI